MHRSHTGLPVPLRLLLLLLLLLLADADRFAICVVGQLARLELASKINRLFVPALRDGHELGVFFYLDGSAAVQMTAVEAAGSFSAGLYDGLKARDIKRWVVKHVVDAVPTAEANLTVEATLHNWPAQHYVVVPPRANVTDLRPPVDAKLRVKGVKGTLGNASVSAHDRFQMHFTQLAHNRECMKRVTHAELRRGAFYHAVVRLRDDAFVFAPWRLQRTPGLLTVQAASMGGVNDHAYLVQRRYADEVLRSPIESYYLDSRITGSHWGLNEHLMARVARSHLVPVHASSVCELPQISHRGLLNATHWRVQASYAEGYLEEEGGGAACDPLGVLNTSSAAVEFPDSLRLANAITPGASAAVCAGALGLTRRQRWRRSGGVTRSLRLRGVRRGSMSQPRSDAGCCAGWCSTRDGRVFNFCWRGGCVFDLT